MIEMEATTADPNTLRRAFACYPSGVTAVCAIVDDEPIGMAASSFTSVSIAPPLVSVCFQNDSATWPLLRRRPRLGISVLAEEHDEVCMRLAAKSSDRFTGICWDRTPDGGVLVPGAAAWLECSVHSELPAGDHTVALLEIHSLHVSPETAPLIFHGSRFRRLATV
ncbi:flavin reductase family protein [Rhodococcus koreensis]